MWVAPIGAFGAIASPSASSAPIRCSRLAASDQFLRHLPHLHFRGALADFAVVRRAPVSVHPLYPRRAPDRDRYHILGDGAAAHDRQTRSFGRGRKCGRTRHPDRLLVQSRWHLPLPRDRGGIFGAGDRHATWYRAAARTSRGAAFGVKGAAGVAGAAFVVLAATLATTGTIPVESVALILGIHRLMSQALTPTNLIGNGIATLVIAKLERALDEGRLNRALMQSGE